MLLDKNDYIGEDIYHIKNHNSLKRELPFGATDEVQRHPRQKVHKAKFGQWYPQIIFIEDQATVKLINSGFSTRTFHEKVLDFSCVAVEGFDEKEVFYECIKAHYATANVRGGDAVRGIDCSPLQLFRNATSKMEMVTIKKVRRLRIWRENEE